MDPEVCCEPIAEYGSEGLHKSAMWRKSMDLAKVVYLSSKELPSDERFGLVSQMRRAAYSIPANIAEGYGRTTSGQFVQFLGIARGSLLELQTMIQLCDELELLQDTSALKALSQECSKLINATLKTLDRGSQQV